MAINQKIERKRVLNLPNSNLIAGSNYELFLGGGVYRNYVVNDSIQLVAQDGKDFIECDTVDDLRALDSRQIWAIQNGYYKGVKLNGYYAQGDTPAPIEYYLSDTEEVDDGGSVFEVGGIKLEHEFIADLHVAYFGAKGDGSDDSSHIIRAGDAVIKYNSRSLSFDNKVYEIGKYSRTNNVLIFLNSNLTIQGNGCTLKLKNGVLLDGGNVKFLFADKDLSNIYIRDLTIDFNGVNNFVSGTIMNFSIAIGSVFNVSNLTLENVIVKNNPARQSILLGNNSSNTIAKQVKIYNCSFYNVGNAIVGNEAQTDHSTLYIHGEDINIYKNSFINERNFITDGIIPTSSAIEIHSDSAKATENYIYNYRNVFNIVGYSKSQENSIYSQNICENVGVFLELWSDGVNILNNISVESNIVLQAYPYGLINGYDHITSNCGLIKIENNHFESTIERTPTHTLPCFYLRRFTDIVIKNNYIKGIRGGVGHFAGSSDIEINITIIGNILKNCGNTDNTSAFTSHKGFLFNLGSFKNIEVSNNKVEQPRIAGVQYITNFFQSDSSSDKIVLKENIVNRETVFIFNGSATYGNIYIKHRGKGVPRNLIRADVGSEYFNEDTNTLFLKTSDNTFVAGWQKQEWATAVPTSGDYLSGDIVHNILPIAARMFVGWVCIGNGSPGTWQPYGGIGIGTATPTVKGLVNQATAVGDVTTADATDDIEAIALVNELKAKINAILASDRTSGQRAT